MDIAFAYLIGIALFLPITVEFLIARYKFSGEVALIVAAFVAIFWLPIFIAWLVITIINRAVIS